MEKYLEMHLLVELVNNAVNCDDNGEPKSCKVGGYDRYRVSSQAWKRSVRERLFELMPDFFNSKNVTIESLAEHIVRGCAEEGIGLSYEKVLQVVTSVLKNTSGKSTPKKSKKVAKNTEQEASETNSTPETEAIGNVKKNDNEESDGKVLYRISQMEYEEIVKKSIMFEGGDENALNNKNNKDNVFRSLDIALYGRMNADAALFCTDGAISIAHAFTTNEMVRQYDYFTGKDDFNNNKGAAHINMKAFANGIYYFCFVIDTEQFFQSIPDINREEAIKALKLAIKTHLTVFPKGQHNSKFANQAPECIFAISTNGQPMTMASAFSVPTDKLQEAIEKLRKEIEWKSRFRTQKVTEFSRDSNETIDSVVDKVMN